MSVAQYFREVEAVVDTLDGYANRNEANQPYKRPNEEEFTAIWQAGELLARAYQVLMADVSAELAKQALILPDPVEKPSGLILPDVPLPGL